MINNCERHPWLDQGYHPLKQLNAQYTSASTLLRRGVNGSLIWQVNLTTWCRLHNISKTIVTTPTDRGGFGVGPPSLTSVKPPVPTFVAPPITVALLPSTLRAERNRLIEAKLTTLPTDRVMQEVMSARLSVMLTEQSALLFTTKAMASFKERIHKYKAKATRIALQPLRFPGVVLPVILDKPSCLYGSMFALKRNLEVTKVYMTRDQLREYLLVNFPEALPPPRVGLATWLDWVTGSMSLAVQYCSPLLSKIIINTTATWVEQYFPAREWASALRELVPYVDRQMSATWVASLFWN
jgi:hypothetical protein